MWLVQSTVPGSRYDVQLSRNVLITFNNKLAVITEGAVKIGEQQTSLKNMLQ
jgi:hypothetical protein